jgi:hypothetical protein
LQELVESQITSGDRMQTLSKGYSLPSWNVSKGYPLPYNTLLQRVQGCWIAACKKLYLHAAIYPTPLHHFRRVSTDFMKIGKKQLNTQLPFNDKHSRCQQNKNKQT